MWYEERLSVSQVGLYRWTRSVRWQMENTWCAGQMALPIVNLILQHGSLQPFSLPDDVIDILDREYRQGNSFSLHLGLKEAGDLTLEYPHGPAIRNDMMHCQHEQVLLQVESEQCCS